MNVDVVIVGGGPAGCASALTLRANGHSVAIIDSCKRFEKPTETAIPELRQLLCALGAEAALSACEPCFGISSRWGQAQPAFLPSIMSPSGDAWFVHRTPFDQCLQPAARRAGTAWFETKALQVDFNTSCVSVETANNTSLRARWLVLATGSPSWPASVTRQAPLNIDTLIAFWSHLPTRLDERILFVEATEYGWWYLCPAEGESTIACFMTDARSARMLKVSQTDIWNKLFNATELSRRLDNKMPAITVQVAATGVTALQQTSGPGWIAVGDAAVRLDPICSSGTFTALDSGRRAALAISESLRGNAAAIASYSRWMTGLLNEFIRQRDKHYTIEANQRTNAFWLARISHAA